MVFLHPLVPITLRNSRIHQWLRSGDHSWLLASLRSTAATSARTATAGGTRAPQYREALRASRERRAARRNSKAGGV